MTKSFNLTSTCILFILLLFFMNSTAQTCPGTGGVTKTVSGGASGFSALWSPVSGASGYNVKVYINQNLHTTYVGSATSYSGSLPTGTYHVKTKITTLCGKPNSGGTTTTGILVFVDNVDSDSIICDGLQGIAAHKEHNYYDIPTNIHDVKTTQELLNTYCSNGSSSKVIIAPKTALSPNPFSGNTSLNFHLKEHADVGLELFDTKGKQYNLNFQSQTLEPGIHNLPINGSDLPVGVYFVKLFIDGEITLYKLMKIE